MAGGFDWEAGGLEPPGEGAFPAGRGGVWELGSAVRRSAARELGWGGHCGLGAEGRCWATSSCGAGLEDSGPFLPPPPAPPADALSPRAVVIEDDRIDDVLKGMGEKPPSGV